MDSLGLGEAEFGPRLSAVDRLVDAAADARRVARIAFAGPGPKRCRASVGRRRLRRSKRHLDRRTPVRTSTPPSSDFQTPPLAAPAQMILGLPGTPATAPMRPPHTAGPMARAFAPASMATSTGCCAAARADSTSNGRDAVRAEAIGRARYRNRGSVLPRECGICSNATNLSSLLTPRSIFPWLFGIEWKRAWPRRVLLDFLTP